MRIERVLDTLIAAGLEYANGKERETEEMLRGLTGEDWEKLWNMSSLHQIWGIVWAGLAKFPRAGLPEKIREKFESAAKQVALQYYSMLSFTTFVLAILKEAQIPCYLLKGIVLNSFYPSEEMRKLADADIYIPNMDDFRRAEELLRSRGFVPEAGGAPFHTGYQKVMGGKSYLLELHWRPCDFLPDAAMDDAAMDIFSRLPYQPEICRIGETDIPILPPEENALQLVLHMFQHLIGAGFGFRALCDWCVFWRENYDRVDSGRFLTCLRQTGLTGLAWAATEICVTCLELDEVYVPWMKLIDAASYGDSAKLLYEDVIVGGEFGRGERARVVALRKHSFALVSYVEPVHRMMQSRFPRWKKVIVAWPVLWAVTLLIFFKNNRSMRRGSTVDVIKSAKKRETLLEKMKVFER